MLAKSTGSHCGGQASPRTEGCDLELGRPSACESCVRGSTAGVRGSTSGMRLTLLIERVREHAALFSKV